MGRLVYVGDKAAKGEPRHLTICASKEKQVERITLTTAQAAQVLGLHPRTIRKLVHTQRLRALRVGRKLLIPQSALEALVQQAK